MTAILVEPRLVTLETGESIAASDLWEPRDLPTAIKLAKHMVLFACKRGVPVAFEVVRTRNGKGPFECQPAGMSALFKSHKLLHVEPIPEQYRSLA